MMKRSLLWAGIAGLALAAGAAEPAANAKAQNDPAPAVVSEEETITIVAVPCAAAPADRKCSDANKCADKKKCSDANKCADKKKACPPDKGACPGKAGCAAAKQPAADFSDADYDLACVFMETSGLPQGFDDANAFMIEEQMDQMPMLRPARPVFEDFFKRYCSYEALKRDLARVHLETFTRDEMRKLIDFFKTPEGKKFAASQSELTKRTLALRAQRMHRHLPELQQQVHAALTKAQPQPAPAAAAAATRN
ncbi:MAG: DUF2059 domain-containing protein [Lentisphaeria bacterium]|nr:DUF2059 domain-containing protein [Lentisphaeria bacterium]